MNRRQFLERLGAAVGVSAHGGLETPGHSLLSDYPGKVALDLWGWETTPFYQRPEGQVLSPDDMVRRAIDESWKWGANLVEIYRGGYPLERRAGWTTASTAALNHHIHERDMVVHWFPHRLDTCGEASPNVISHVPEGETPSNTFPGAIQAVRALGEQFDALRVSGEELLDGLGSEQWPVMPPELFDRCVWPYNPAMYFYTDNHAFDETMPNEIDVSASNGFGSDDQTSGYYQLHAKIRKRYGLQFWASQAECRSGVPANGFGGLGYPDWMLKQVNDQFRGRAHTPGRDLSPSALWWINEAEDVCPEENRRYVYGISQDPVKCAVTARFTVLGQGGLRADGRGFPQRYPYPAGTAFIQNNSLCAVVFNDRDQSTLLLDPTRLAHYDADSRAVPVCHPFGRTVLLPGDRPAQVNAVAFEHAEPAGFKAVLKTRLRMQGVEETRTLTVLNDAPYMLLEIERATQEAPVALGLRFGFAGYDRIITTETAAVPGMVRLQDSSGHHPHIALLVLESGALTGLRWQPHEGLTLESGAVAQGRFRIALVAPEGLYDEAALGELRAFLRGPEETVTLGPSGRATVHNPLGIPVVKVVRVMAAGPDPYQVREFGRWIFRGAQPSLMHHGEDYLKCYLPPWGSAVIQKYGFIETAVRPGWGCQYSIALRDCRPRQHGCSVTAEVNQVTSFLFAPRLRFRARVSEVRVNGRPWAYFDGCVVFLPNRRGEYRVEVIKGEARAPYLARTFACIDSATWCEGHLTFEARLPEWVDGVPNDFRFTAVVRHPGRTVAELANAEVVRGGTEATVITFTPGTISLTLSHPGNRQAVAPIDLDADIEQHLARLSAAMLTPYLGPFRTDTLPFRAVEDDASILDAYDVLVWNHYFLDELPKHLSPKVLDAIRKHIAAGAGALLLLNAVRAFPTLVGYGPQEFRTAHIGHNLNAYCEFFGIEAVGKGHPVFCDMSPREPGTTTFPLMAPASFDIFKRVLWQARGGRVLGRMSIAFKDGRPKTGPVYEPSPLLREWPLGAGHVLTYDAGLRCSLGSLNRWTPSENLKTFVQNMVRYLAPRRAEVRVANLW